MSGIRRIASPLPLPFSRATIAGGFLFLSGQIPYDAQGEVVRGSIQDQTHAVFDRLIEGLALANATLADVVKATVWLSDMALFADFNKVYAERFGDTLPTRSLVEAKLAKKVDVEIEVQAWLGDRA